MKGPPKRRFLTGNLIMQAQWENQEQVGGPYPEEHSTRNTRMEETSRRHRKMESLLREFRAQKGLLI
jgi:hypothetical protein